MSIDCIIKLGGSAISFKDKFETLNVNGLSTAVEIVKKILSTSQDSSNSSGCTKNNNEHGLSIKFQQKIIIVHGAGSFGHFQAKQYGVNQGYQDKIDLENKRLGFAKTRISVQKLNHAIVSRLVEGGVPAVGVSPCCGWRTKDGSEISSSDVTTIEGLLQQGYIPVMHGDCAIDDTQGCSILSGDKIIEHLCAKFNPNWVAFLSDVDGVYDRPPQDQDAKVIPTIVVDPSQSFLQGASFNNRSHDVTGGIRRKLECAFRIVNESNGRVKVFVCKLESQAALNVCCHGDLAGEVGTLIEKDVQ